MVFQSHFWLQIVLTLRGTLHGDYKMSLYGCCLGQAVCQKAASRHLRQISPLDQLVSGRCQAREKTAKRYVPKQIPWNPVWAWKSARNIVNLHPLGFIQHVFFGNFPFSWDSMFLASALFIYVIYIGYFLGPLVLSKCFYVLGSIVFSHCFGWKHRCRHS